MQAQQNLQFCILRQSQKQKRKYLQNRMAKLNISRRYDGQQGFSEQEQCQHQIVVHKDQSSLDSPTIKAKGYNHTKARFRQPKIKLSFMGKQKSQIEKLRDKLHDKQSHNAGANSRKTYHESLQIKRKDNTILNRDGIYELIVKTKRTLIGENITLKDYSQTDYKAAKKYMTNKGCRIVFQKLFQPNTHGFLRSLLDLQKNKQKIKGVNQAQNSFLRSKYNGLLRIKLRDSFIMSKNRKLLMKNQQTLTQAKQKKQIVSCCTPRSSKNKIIQNPEVLNDDKTQNQHKLRFTADFQSANMQFVTEVDKNQYNIFMSIDTNTRGHQSWFYFQIESQFQAQKKQTFRFNVCNLKRELKMIHKGAKIFLRKLVKTQKVIENFQDIQYQSNLQTKFTQWTSAGTSFCIKQNQQSLFNGKNFKLSFNLRLNGQSTYQISLLPPYTYSDMLRQIDSYETNENVQVQVLTYSLAGLAIPLITIGKQPYDNKNVILISGRIHPGETVGSFMVKGLLQRLINEKTPQVQELLQSTIIKVIPMINPDGVVFGNFRTNFLGNDLNRCFYTDDEILFPQVCALKSLGQKLKSQFGNRFLMFLDLHGHSSRKNIFTYGPEYEPGTQNFYNSRLLPKILHAKSKYFKYNYCSFKLQDYKHNTARGYFLNNMKVIGYTIQASYGIYDSCNSSEPGNQQKQETPFKVQDWIKFGNQLAESIALAVKISNMNRIKTHSQLKKIISEKEKQQLALMKKLAKDIKKQATQNRNKLNLNQQIKRMQDQIGPNDKDSDGQSQGEDLLNNQRIQIQKKVIQCSLPQVVLPRMVKPAILYPTVTPRLFQAVDRSNTGNDGNVKVLYMRRNKHCAMRMMNINGLGNNSFKQGNLNLSISANFNKVNGQSSNLDIFKPLVKNIKLQKRVQF